MFIIVGIKFLLIFLNNIFKILSSAFFDRLKQYSSLHYIYFLITFNTISFFYSSNNICDTFDNYLFFEIYNQIKLLKICKYVMLSLPRHSNLILILYIIFIYVCMCVYKEKSDICYNKTNYTVSKIYYSFQQF
jgi:hypothetical protein